MWIIHRISIGVTAEVQRELVSMQVWVDKGDSSTGDLFTFEVEEGSAAWPAIREWVMQRKAYDTVITEFTDEEIGRASWLELRAEWYHGYPQPKELDAGYLEATYDLTNYCARCGTGLKQRAPFQMKGEPKWGKRGVLKLNWVFDECFVKRDVWDASFRPNGVECRPVVNRNGVELETVVQLVVKEEASIVSAGLAVEENACTTCQRTKYRPVAVGPFPKVVGMPHGAMVKTKEYFGSGGAAYKGVLVSQAVARELRERQVKGLSFRPSGDV